MAGGGGACLRTMTDAMAKGQARRRRHCARCACHFSSARRENADLHTNEGRAHVGRGGESGSRAERHLNAEVLPRSNALARPRTAATSRDAWTAAQTKEVGRGRHASAFCLNSKLTCLNQTKIGAQKPLEDMSRFLRSAREQNEQRIASREPHDGILSRISS